MARSHISTAQAKATYELSLEAPVAHLQRALESGERKRIELVLGAVRSQFHPLFAGNRKRFTEEEQYLIKEYNKALEQIGLVDGQIEERLCYPMTVDTPPTDWDFEVSGALAAQLELEFADFKIPLDVHHN